MSGRVIAACVLVGILFTLLWLDQPPTSDLPTQESTTPDQSTEVVRSGASPATPPVEESQEVADSAPSRGGTLALSVLTPSGPADGALVSLYEQIAEDRESEEGEEELGEPILSGLSDADGMLNLSGVPDGIPLSLRVTLPWALTRWLPVEALGVGETRQLDAIELQWFGEIAGTVLDERGRRIEGALVSRERSQGRPMSFDYRAIRTDASGEFLISPVRPGEQVTITAWSQGYLRRVGEPIEIEARQQHSIELQLKPGLWSAGVVEFEDGEAVEGAKVTVKTADYSHHPWVHSMTDSRGRFEVTGIPPGRLSMTAKLGDLEREVEVDGVEALPSVVRLPRGGQLAVRVVDSAGSPVSDAWVSPDPVDGYGGQNARSDSSGRVILEHLNVGPHRVSVQREGYRSTRVPVEIFAGQSTEVVIPLELVPVAPTVELHVETRDADGRPVAGVAVELTFLVDRGASLSIEAVNGITGPDGRVSLSYSADPSIDLRFERDGFLVEERRVELPNDGEATYVHALTREARIEAQIFVGESMPLTGDFQIRSLDESMPVEEDPWIVSRYREVAREGELFRLDEIPPGHYEIIASIESGAALTQEVLIEEGSTTSLIYEFPESFEVEVLVFVNGRPAEGGRVSIKLMSEELVQYNLGEDVIDGRAVIPLNFRGRHEVEYTHRDLKLEEKRELRIEGARQVRLDLSAVELVGRVVTPAGEPLSGYRVRIHGASEWSRILDEAGEFVIPAVEPGIHYWVVENPPADLVPYGQFTVGHGGGLQTLTLREGRVVRIIRATEPGRDPNKYGWRLYMNLGEVWARIAWPRTKELRIVVPPGEHEFHALCSPQQRRVSFRLPEDQDEARIELLPFSRD